jgi:protein-tyrosine phosphatase
MNVRTVLFLCTGNYYRSRFAEGLFNHLAPQRDLAWRADSRGLAVGRTDIINIGPISAHTLEAFEQRSIPVSEPIRYPRLATAQDLAAADRVIALKEAEHRPLMREHFPYWENRITYWHVHDLDEAPPDFALAEIDTLVNDLLAGL